MEDARRDQPDLTEEVELRSPWNMVLRVGCKLTVTLIVAAIALALFAVGGVVGGYFYLMQPNAELKDHVRSMLLVAGGVYLVVLVIFGLLVGAMWVWKPEMPRSER